MIIPLLISKISGRPVTNRPTSRVAQEWQKIAVYSHKHCKSASDILCVIGLQIKLVRRRRWLQ